MLCFDEILTSPRDKSNGEHEFDPLIRFKYNYILHFCVQFYLGLAHQYSVKESFSRAEEWIEEN